MARAGGAKRTEELCCDTVALNQLHFFLKRSGKHPRGLHGTYGVGTGGTNAHLKQVKSADRHIRRHQEGERERSVAPKKYARHAKYWASEASIFRFKIILNSSLETPRNRLSPGAGLSHVL